MRAFSALLLCIISPVIFAEVRTTLDRYSVTAADTLLLTLEATDQIEQRPDFSVLDADFRLQSSQKVIISSHTSATRDVKTRWHLQLKPRSTGTLRIPPIRLGDELSEPLEVQVNGRPQPSAQRSERFMDSQISQDQLYSHAQLLLTARLLQRTPVDENITFGAPVLPDALVLTLDAPERHIIERDGTPWHVLEQTFALYPSSAGLHTLTDASVLVDGSPANAPEQRNTFDIEVLPAAHQNSLGYWLPAERLTLTENWQPPGNLQPGDSFTRELKLTALGLPADALPNLFSSDNDSFFAQLIDVSLTEQPTRQGLVSTRIERVRIEPLGPGLLTLPSIDLHWWNTLADRADTLTLPTRTLEVHLPSLPEGSRQDSATAINTPASSPAEPLYIALTGLGLLCLISSGGWFYSHRQLQRLQARDQPQNETEKQQHEQQVRLSSQRAERNTFQALTIACQQNDADTARLRLIEWSQNFWPEYPVNNLDDVCEAAHSQAFSFLVLDLDHHRQQSPYTWQGDLLLEAIEALRNRRRRNDSPPLSGSHETRASLPLAS
ncbi:BatD family protein [Marinobacterium marinum]|uniref:BatD family protein n=1 Tax=Marinobacterium marinum TaxID=2756129 RepID=A0A7W1WXT2_9GAMM|nr:BatD family protein [Marinobacterium marinum]MBA4502071.1 BatD family protein [Marinobacterium marinum]